MFHENGAIRIPTNKSSLKKTLQLEHSGRTSASADVVIIDGCAMMWVIHWPTNGTVADYANNFMHYICSIMDSSDVFLTFDQY